MKIYKNKTTEWWYKNCICKHTRTYHYFNTTPDPGHIQYQCFKPRCDCKKYDGREFEDMVLRVIKKKEVRCL